MFVVVSVKRANSSHTAFGMSCAHIRFQCSTLGAGLKPAAWVWNCMKSSCSVGMFAA